MVVILLNGPGSVGKTALARALQDLVARPLVHVEMDRVLAMLPERFQEDPQLVAYHPGPQGVTVEVGPRGAALLATMRRWVADLAAAGFDLVVDDVWLAGEPADYAAQLAPFRVVRVGLQAPLAVLEAREAARGDRMAGLARAQVARVHHGLRYDLMLDMGALTPEAAARQIAVRAALA